MRLSPNSRPGVYCITSPDGMYVGGCKNIQTRWTQHKRELRKGTHANSRLQGAWTDYGEHTFEFQVILFCRDDDLLFFEQLVIDGLQPQYNLTLPADRGPRWKQSPETRAKHAAAMTGRSVSEETRAKLAKQRGWKHSEEAKAKMRGRVVSAETRVLQSADKRGNQNRLGQSLSEESRQRISASLKGRPRSPESIAKQRAAWEARRR
jgi:group I intron endonuclease